MGLDLQLGQVQLGGQAVLLQDLWGPLGGPAGAHSPPNIPLEAQAVLQRPRWETPGADVLQLGLVETHDLGSEVRTGCRHALRAVWQERAVHRRVLAQLAVPCQAVA